MSVEITAAAWAAEQARSEAEAFEQAMSRIIRQPEFKVSDEIEQAYRQGYEAGKAEVEEKHWSECAQIAHYDNDIKELALQIKGVKKSVGIGDSDYLTGYICALSAVEGMIAELIGGAENEIHD